MSKAAALTPTLSVSTTYQVALQAAIQAYDRATAQPPGEVLSGVTQTITPSPA